MTSPLQRSAVCLVTDRLSAGFLGAYGNTWINTPSFDQLAFESLLFDQAILCKPTLSDFYEEVWAGESQQALPQLLNDVGIDTLLITDEPGLLANGRADAFRRCVTVEAGSERVAVEDIEQTCLGRFFAMASDCVAELTDPTLVWLHSRGMAAPWDAPYSMRDAYAEDEDPRPPTGIEVPRMSLNKDHDPDELLGLTHAYAGQVSLWDVCLGALLEAFQSNPFSGSALFSVMSCQGFPLGLHDQVGQGGDCYGELLHIPWLVRVPGEPLSQRSSLLVQPSDMFEMLNQWWELSDAPAPGLCEPGIAALGGSVREFIVSEGAGGCWSIRTPAWFLRNKGGANGQELYVKPDDRWESSDVAGRCNEVVELLCEVYDKVARGEHVDPLDEVLLEGIR
ncbi:MAG: sulfatase-like hydrolase/transferase [Planctomycetales bacterium]